MDPGPPWSTLYNPDVVESWVEGRSDHGLLVHPVDLDGHFIPGGSYQLWSDRDLSQIEPCGDVDGDGKDDIILAVTSFREAGTTVAVYPSPHVGMERGDVLFGVSGIGYGSALLSHGCVDVDADGDAEVGINVRWFEGASAVGFATVLYPGGL